MNRTLMDKMEGIEKKIGNMIYEKKEEEEEEDAKMNLGVRCFFVILF